MRIGQTFLRDAIERSVSTYVQAFLGLLITSGITDIGVIKTAAIAAIPAALSVVKSVLAEKYAPGTVSPASLAKA